MAVEEPEVAPVAEVATEEPAVESQEEDVGPPVPKKRKAVNANELNLLENLPAADRYERSYMHRNGPLFSVPHFSSFFLKVTNQSPGRFHHSHQIKLHHYKLNRRSCKILEETRRRDRIRQRLSRSLGRNRIRRRLPRRPPLCHLFN